MVSYTGSNYRGQMYLLVGIARQLPVCQAVQYLKWRRSHGVASEYKATHVIFEPVDFIAKLAALVSKPRVNLTRFHGVFAPNSKHRALVTPAKRGEGNKPKVADGQEEQTPVRRLAAMTGFCSCKTGIHAIHGNNLGAAAEAGFQD